jgi:hypothetical protein
MKVSANNDRWNAIDRLQLLLVCAVGVRGIADVRRWMGEEAVARKQDSRTFREAPGLVYNAWRGTNGTI